MALDLAPIQNYQGPVLDIAGDLAKGQQIQKSQNQLDAEAKLPAAITAYKNGDQGALLQIAQAKPEMAQTIISMENEKRQAALTNVQIQGAQQEMQQRGFQIKQEQLAAETQAAQGAIAALRGVESTDDKKKVYSAYLDTVKRQGIPIPPELDGEWTPHHEEALQHIADIGNMMMNPPKLPEGYTWQGGKAVRVPGLPIDPNNIGALLTPGGGAPTPGAGGAPQQGPTQAGAPLGAQDPTAGLAQQGSPDQMLASLQQNNPGMASDVKMALEGKYPISTRNSAQTQLVMRLANMIDPSFDPTQYQARVKTAKDYSPQGDAGKQFIAMGTAASHLADAYDAFQEIKNSGVPLVGKSWNAIANAAREQGDSEISKAIAKFDTAVNVAAPELTKIASGKTNISEKEIQDWRDKFNHNLPPGQMDSVFQEAASIIQGRAIPLVSAYTTQMGNRKPPTLQPFDDRTLKLFSKMGSDLSDVNAVATAGSAPSSAAGAKTPKDGREVLPAGVDKRLWDHMTEDEKKLFTK